MFAICRNLLLFALVSGHSWPEAINKYVTGQLLIAWTADSAGLYAYPQCKKWREAQSAWQDVIASDGRPLSEMLRFPAGVIPGEEPSLYLRIAYGVITPHRLACAREAARYGRREWEAFEEYAKELNLRYLIYDLLDDLTRDSVPLYRKRQKLAQLRELLGPEAYEAGKVPPAIP